MQGFKEISGKYEKINWHYFSKYLKTEENSQEYRSNIEKILRSESNFLEF